MGGAALSPCLFKTRVGLAPPMECSLRLQLCRDGGSPARPPAELSQGQGPPRHPAARRGGGVPGEGVQGGKEDLCRDRAARSGQGGGSQGDWVVIHFTSDSCGSSRARGGVKENPELGLLLIPKHHDPPHHSARTLPSIHLTGSQLALPVCLAWGQEDQPTRQTWLLSDGTLLPTPGPYLGSLLVVDAQRQLHVESSLCDYMDMRWFPRRSSHGCLQARKM